MAHTPKPAIRGMLIYVIALLAFGLIVGAIYTIYGSPSNPAEPSAAETIPQRGS